MFFKNFPNTIYKFGSNEPFVKFQNFGKAAILSEESVGNTTIYEKYTIMQGERPDTLSYKLYGTTQYYWTFFLCNNSLKESGWPLGSNELYHTALENYPHRVVTTTTNIGTTNFKKGQIVTGSQSGSTGPVVEVNLNLGTIVIKTNDNFNVGETLTVGTGGDIQTCIITGESTQYDSVHHYENAELEYADINPHNPDLGGLTAKTHIQRMIDFNDNLSNIIVINPKIVQRVASQFTSKLKET
jgi:hypothetical protein|tara:strand:- start:2236 stop:2961 length:726 start_codon:yes stop_codon:yes gene_type:complete